VEESVWGEVYVEEESCIEEGGSRGGVREVKSGSRRRELYGGGR
jgi:hypothetical protein